MGFEIKFLDFESSVVRTKTDFLDSLLPKGLPIWIIMTLELSVVLFKVIKNDTSVPSLTFFVLVVNLEQISRFSNFQCLCSFFKHVFDFSDLKEKKETWVSFFTWELTNQSSFFHFKFRAFYKDWVTNRQKWWCYMAGSPYIRCGEFLFFSLLFLVLWFCICQLVFRT